MSAIILFSAVSLTQLMLVASMAIVSVRMFIGPRAQDRIIGLDTFYINAMLLLVTFGVGTGREIYFEAALVIGMLGFVASVALGKFLMRGEVIE
ncbi:K+/H+ antiporter subunit F [Agrobacterium vitis]|uniref:K+/H+ antiporter subunit F n=1 Tax=Agrobacterium vitis TaxID=373 RepID=UPI0012E8DF3F|nr:K+/H+ antiporter subunit F [Agrobacterium vitis]MVA60109.1 K+/H+ antiporter subunit F [Agrobacterium vitis]